MLRAVLRVAFERFAWHDGSMKKRAKTPAAPSSERSVEDTLAHLRDNLGARALERLRAGKATFRVWRGTTPYNKWVEGPRGACLWHSDEGNRGPDILAFESIEDSKDRITHHWMHDDGGLPFMSVYVLKPRYRL